MHSFGKFDDLFFNNLSTSLNLSYIGLWLFSSRYCVNQHGRILFRDWIRCINKNIVKWISVEKSKLCKRRKLMQYNNKVYLLADYCLFFFFHISCVWKEPKTIFHTEEIVFWKECYVATKRMLAVINFIINNDEIYSMSYNFISCFNNAPLTRNSTLHKTSFVMVHWKTYYGVIWK